MRKTILMLLVFFILPSTGYTHSAWIYASPEEGEVLTAPPQRVIFKMIGFLDAEQSTVEVFDKEGKRVSGKAVFLRSGDFTTIEVELFDGLTSGEYTVMWSFVNRDRHIQPGQKGSYTFTVQ